MIFEGLGTAADEKDARLVNDNGADTDERRSREFAFDFSAHIRGDPGVLFKGNSPEDEGFPRGGSTSDCGHSESLSCRYHQIKTRRREID